MNKLFSKSREDLPKITSLSKEDLILKNILHMTYQLDELFIRTAKIMHEMDIQSQANKYYQEKIDDDTSGN